MKRGNLRQRRSLLAGIKSLATKPKKKGDVNGGGGVAYSVHKELTKIIAGGGGGGDSGESKGSRQTLDLGKKKRKSPKGKNGLTKGKETPTPAGGGTCSPVTQKGHRQRAWEGKKNFRKGKRRPCAALLKENTRDKGKSQSS